MLKQFPNPMVGLPTSRWLFLATVVVSVGLHGVLLGLPLSEQSVEPDEPEMIEDENKVKVLSLADEPAGKGNSDKLAPPPKTTLPPAPKPPKSSPAPRTPSKTTPAKATTPAISPTPQTTPSNTQTPTPDEEAPGNPGESVPGDPPGTGTQPSDTFPDLPEYPNALVGSAGFFWQQDKADVEQLARNTSHVIAKAVQFYQTEAPKQGIGWTPKIQESDLHVYEMTSGTHDPRFIHFIQHQNKTVIVVLEQDMTLAELQEQQQFAQMDEEERQLDQIFVSLTPPDIEIDTLNVPPPPREDFKIRAVLPESTALQTLNDQLALQKLGPQMYMVSFKSDPSITVGTIQLVQVGDNHTGVYSNIKPLS